MRCRIVQMPGGAPVAGSRNERAHRFRRPGRVPMALTATAASALAWTSVTAVQAQTAAAPATAQLEEITVTARKREERLQDLPIAVTAFSAEDIERQGLRDITEVAQFTPGFSMQNVGATTEQPFIRGMSVTSFERTLQTASTYLDGVYGSVLGRAIFFDDVARVEVVKGPQAALFGRATFAGAINYVTKKPTPQHEGFMRVAYGEYGLAEAHGSWSGPLLGEALQFRVSASSREYEGAFSDPADGAPLGDEDHTGYTAALRWQPSDSLTADLTWLSTQFRDRGQQPQYLQPSSTLNCFPNASGVFTYYCGELRPTEQWLGLNLALVDGAYTRMDQDRGILDVRWDAGAVTFVSTSSYAYQTSATFCDCDYTDLVSLGGAFHSLFATTIRNRSQELRVESNGEAGFRWLAGVYWFDEDSVTGRVNTPTPPPLPYVDIRTLAAFASVSIPLLDRWSLDLDVRYQDENQQRTAIPGNPARDETYTSTLPRAIVNFRATPDLLLYASASKGNQPGQFNNGANIPPDLVKVDEEQIWSYEAGLKASWLDRRLATNVAVYHIDWTNQVYRTEAVGTDGRPINVLANLGGSRINGAELEGAWQLNDAFSIRVGYAYTDAEYTDFLSPNALRVYGNAQVAGNPLPNTPKQTFFASLGWQQPLPWGEDVAGFAQLDYQWRDEQPVAELPEAYVGDANLANLRAGVDIGRLRLAIVVENLFDDDAPEYATRFSDTNSPGLSRFGYLINLREPRRWSGQVSYRF